MKKGIFSVFISIFILIITDACSNNKNSTTESKIEQSEQYIKTQQGTILDPNKPKAMALMMRQMASNADSMKSILLSGKSIDSLHFPFIRFYLAEPTDPSVLEPLFYENARLFQHDYKNIFIEKNNQIIAFNTMVGKCINCHENYCNGPLKRIKKLLIESK